MEKGKNKKKDEMEPVKTKEENLKEWYILFNIVEDDIQADVLAGQ